MKTTPITKAADTFTNRFTESVRKYIQNRIKYFRVIAAVMLEVKVLVTGASGLLGRQVMAELTAAGVPCLGLAHSRPGPGLVQLDLTDLAAARSFVLEHKPSHVIHAAAQRFPDKVEADFEAAKLLNVETSRTIAEACQEAGARMIYISTDYVFPGDHPPYFPDNPARPLNKYGETKLAGEGAVLGAAAGHLVLRVPVLYGGVTQLTESAVTVLLEVVRRGAPATVSSYEVRCPSHTRDIARILRDLVSEIINKLKVSYPVISGH